MRRQQKIALLVAILTSSVVFLDGSVVNVALPAITRELGGGLATQQWVVDAYALTLGSLMLAAGSLSDIFGRKKILWLGLAGFGVTSFLCALAPNTLFLIVARGIQGASGAMLVPSSLAIIISDFPAATEGKAIGRWTAWTGAASVFGPLLGGFLVDAVSWRLIFAINIVPILVILWIMRDLREPERPEKAHIDTLGLFLCTLGLAGPVYALIEQEHYGWSNPRIWLTLLVGAITMTLFLVHERRAYRPLLPPSLFEIRNFSVGNAATLCVYAGLSLAAFVVAVFVQQTGGYSAVTAGLTLLPASILMIGLSSRFGALAGKLGPRWFMAAGPSVSALGFISLLRVELPINYWTQFLPGILCMGLGLALTVAPLTTAVLGCIDHRRGGIGSAVNNAMSRVAGLVAVSFLGIITGGGLSVAGFHRAVVVIAGLFIAGALVSALGIENTKNVVRPKA